MKKAVMLVLMVLAAGWTRAQAPGAGQSKDTAAAVTVEKVVTAAGLENHQPVGEASVFEAGTAQVFCWAKLSIAAPPVKLKFVWSREGKVISEYVAEIKVASPYWTASKKVRAGAWKVDVQNESGESLNSTEFTVKAAGSPEGPTVK
ncbi:MAG: DUF2914 domain-containing protein [Elusimicrobia bacterium]|nr:DUF2914 domain-containing protein [Elusimicrobiota bacterium]